MGLKWDAIPQNEKLKIMDKMLRYIRKNAETIYNMNCPKDLYEVCKTVACTDLFYFLQDYCEEV